jgi:two-component system CheB/CheR fusion protein
MDRPSTEWLQEALLESEARFHALVERSPDGIVVTAPDGTIRFLNPTAVSMLGHPGHLWRGEPLPWPIRGGESSEVNLPGDGTDRVAQIRVREISWEGEPALLVTLDDVTAHRKRELELCRSLRRRDHFLAILSHELRNPLSAIVNAAQILQRGKSNPKSLGRAREVIEKQSLQMTRLLDDLLDISRISEGKIELRRRVIDLRQTAHEAVETVALQMAERLLALEVQLPDHPLYVDGDPARLLQVFTNLLGNAAKYTEVDGHVWLTVQAEQSEAVVRVRDTGIGISPDRLESIFEPFFQEDSTVSRSNGGMGIGLALVRSLVRFHGGTVQAESAGPGRGSTFIVRLPLAACERRTAPRTERSADISDMRILIIEDNANAREMLQAVLELEGHEVAAAGSGREGIELIEFQHPEVALVDIGLPDFDGYEVARQVRRNPDNNDVYLVALTGYGQPSDRQQALEAGFDAHLVKPVQLEELTKLFADRRTARPKE